MMFGISAWWVLLAVVVYFAAGALWYSPLLFSKLWQAEIKKKSGDVKMTATPMVITFLAMAVLVVFLTYMLHATGTTGVWRSAYLALKIWVGFVATTALVNNVFQSASKRLFAIDQGYHLVGMLLAAIVLAH
jgi:uncharacterized membrane protein